MVPTVLDVLGLPPSPTFEGNSLLPAIEADRNVASLPGVAFAEMLVDLKAPHRLHTAITRDWQIIANFQLGTHSLYHLAEDPWGTRDVASRHVDDLERMEDLLRTHIAEELQPLKVVKLPKGQRALDKGFE